MKLLHSGLVLALCLTSISHAATVHEDDPKALVPARPVLGPGLRAGLPPRPDAGHYTVGMSQDPEMFDASGLALLAWMPLIEFESSSGSDCWGYVSPGGREYALFTHHFGLAVIDVTVPHAPTVIYNEPDGPSSTWHDVKVYGNYAYAVSEGGGGVRVFDLSGVDSGTVVKVGSATAGGPVSTHNVAINTESGFLYRCGGTSDMGLRIYDLSVPETPTYVATWPHRYVHDAQVVNWTEGTYAGREIAFCCTGMNGGHYLAGVDILDVTDKQNIALIKHLDYSGSDYSHQLWLSEDRTFLYLNDEHDEDVFDVPTTTHVFRIGNLPVASYVGSYTNGSEAVDHNLYVHQGRIYAANYSDGVRIFDASVPTSPVEIAYFDTHPEDEMWLGAWTVYPYLPSGNLIVSDRTRGLFVLYPGDSQLSFQFPQGLPDHVSPEGEELVLSVQEASPGLLDPASVSLYLDTGGGFTQIAATPLGGGDYSVAIPPLPCPSSVQFYFTATSTTGIPWSDPPTSANGVYSRYVSADYVAGTVEEFENGSAGWSSGAPGDAAGPAAWTLDEPSGFYTPGEDHTPDGSSCWYTPSDPDGPTSLLSPVWNLSSYDQPVVGFWRWLRDSTTPALRRSLRLEVSEDGGQTWGDVELPLEDKGWVRQEVSLRDHIQSVDQVRLKFVIGWQGPGVDNSAALDDVRIDDYPCVACPSQTYCIAEPNSTGSAAQVATLGTNSISSNDLQLVSFQVPPLNTGLFIYSPDAVDPGTPLGNGRLCLGTDTLGYILRLDPINADSLGTMTYSFDNTAPSTPDGQVSAGETWNFQLWYRDPAAGLPGFNFSDAMQVTFCP